MRLFERDPGVFIKIWLRKGWPVVVLRESVSVGIYIESVLPRENIEAWVIEMRYTESLCRLSVLLQFQEKRVYAFVLGHHVPNSNVRGSSVSCQGV